MKKPDDGATLEQWLKYLESVHHTEIDLGLDRIKQVATSLGLNDLPYKTIIVGGTNGKGSVCAMLDSILLAGGYKTASYTSPHLVKYNERIRINGQFASDEQIIKQFELIDTARKDTTLSYFEFSTLAALLLFKEIGVDIAMLEVGLGGRLDAANIVDADCAVITSVDIDHVDYLGDNRESIGFEKAHIFRPNKPAICADPLPPQSLIDYASKINADLWLFGKDFNYSGDQQQWAYGGREQRRNALAYPALRGANQLLNAAAALAAIESLRPDIVVPAHALRLGFLHAALPGRFQIMPGQPTVILDVAHNAHAASALAHNLSNMPNTGVTYGVIGMLNDKDIKSVIKPLINQIDHWFCADLDSNRAISVDELEKIISLEYEANQSSDQTLRENTNSYSGINIVDNQINSDKPSVKPGIKPRKLVDHLSITKFNNPIEAFNKANEKADLSDRIVVFGSFFMVGPILGSLQK